MTITDGGVRLMCRVCAHWDGDADGPRCDAFPGGIPERFWSGREFHYEGADGDGGVVFTPDHGRLEIPAFLRRPPREGAE